jgi:hypothetical protein
MLAKSLEDLNEFGNGQSETSTGPLEIAVADAHELPPHAPAEPIVEATDPPVEDIDAMVAPLSEEVIPAAVVPAVDDELQVPWQHFPLDRSLTLARREVPRPHAHGDHPITRFWQDLDGVFEGYPTSTAVNPLPIIRLNYHSPLTLSVDRGVPRSIRRAGVSAFLSNLRDYSTRNFAVSNRLQEEELAICRAMLIATAELMPAILRSDITEIERLLLVIQEYSELLQVAMTLEVSERRSLIDDSNN